jgi:hypothetical protein
MNKLPDYRPYLDDMPEPVTAQDLDDADWLIAHDKRDAVAKQIENDTTIRQIMLGQWGEPTTQERVAMVAKLAARNVRADDTNTLTRARALTDASRCEFDTYGDPQKFPYDNASTACVRAAGELDPEDQSPRAQHLREVAQSVRDHRASYREGHTTNCRGDLRRGYCHR